MNTPAQCGAIKPSKTDIYSEAPQVVRRARSIWHPSATPPLGGGTPVPPTLLAVMRTDTDEGSGDSGLNSEDTQTEDGTR